MSLYYGSYELLSPANNSVENNIVVYQGFPKLGVPFSRSPC